MIVFVPSLRLQRVLHEQEVHPNQPYNLEIAIRTGAVLGQRSRWVGSAGGGAGRSTKESGAYLARHWEALDFVRVALADACEPVVELAPGGEQQLKREALQAAREGRWQSALGVHSTTSDIDALQEVHPWSLHLETPLARAVAAGSTEAVRKVAALGRSKPEMVRGWCFGESRRELGAGLVPGASILSAIGRSQEWAGAASSRQAELLDAVEEACPSEQKQFSNDTKNVAELDTYRSVWSSGLTGPLREPWASPVAVLAEQQLRLNHWREESNKALLPQSEESTPTVLMTRKVLQHGGTPEEAAGRGDEGLAWRRWAGLLGALQEAMAGGDVEAVQLLGDAVCRTRDAARLPSVHERASGPQGEVGGGASISRWASWLTDREVQLPRPLDAALKASRNALISIVMGELHPSDETGSTSPALFDEDQRGSWPSSSTVDAVASRISEQSTLALAGKPVVTSVYEIETLARVLRLARSMPTCALLPLQGPLGAWRGAEVSRDEMIDAANVGQAAIIELIAGRIQTELESRSRDVGAKRAKDRGRWQLARETHTGRTALHAAASRGFEQATRAILGGVHGARDTQGADSISGGPEPTHELALDACGRSSLELARRHRFTSVLQVIEEAATGRGQQLWSSSRVPVGASVQHMGAGSLASACRSAWDGKAGPASRPVDDLRDSQTAIQRAWSAAEDGTQARLAAILEERAVLGILRVRNASTWTGCDFPRVNAGVLRDRPRLLEILGVGGAVPVLIEGALDAVAQTGGAAMHMATPAGLRASVGNDRIRAGRQAYASVYGGTDLHTTWDRLLEYAQDPGKGLQVVPGRDAGEMQAPDGVREFQPEHVNATRLQPFQAASMKMPPDSFLGLPPSRVLAALGLGKRHRGSGLPPSEPHARHHAPIENHLFVGPGVSGTQMHVHAAAVNLLLGGRKLWITRGAGGARAEQRPSMQLLTDILIGGEGIHDGQEQEPGAADGQYEFCIQQAGDAVFVPEMHGHATVNLGGLNAALTYVLAPSGSEDDDP